MTTIGESISRMRNLVKGADEDAFLTDRLIYSILIKNSKAIINRQDVEDKLMKYESLFSTLPFVDLIEVDKIEASCAAIKTGCKIMRTKKKLPKLMTNSSGPILRVVSSIDGQDIFQQCNAAVYVSMNNSTTFKYNKTKYFWFKNDYLYFPNILWDAVSVEGMFEGSIAGFCNDDEDENCKLIQDTSFKIPEYLLAEVEGMSFKELAFLLNIPEDVSDNSQQILR